METVVDIMSPLRIFFIAASPYRGDKNSFGGKKHIYLYVPRIGRYGERGFELGFRMFFSLFNDVLG